MTSGPSEKLDPRGYHAYPIAAPTAGKDYHYLWRFWRRLLPTDEKQVVIFDRSWYGRVLVERVEGFATEEEWKRAYGEIKEFEPAHGPRFPARQILVPHRQRRAASTVRGAAQDASQALEADRRGLPK